MKIGAWYVVTKPSNDGTFEVGDHVMLLSNGDIACKEDQGWGDAKDAEQALSGAEVTIDVEWIAAKKARLLADLEKLEELQ